MSKKPKAKSKNSTYDKPESIGLILKRALSTRRLREKWNIIQIQKYWKEIVGEAIYNNAQPHNIIQGVLKVGVSSSTWMQQLQFMKDTIKGNINKRLKGQIINDIRLELMALPLEKTDQKVSRIPWDGIEVNGTVKGFFKRGRGGIKDKDLRRLFRSIIVKQRRLDTYKILKRS
ncbi:MAG TPA: DUF721 domain-containing protein [Syntrophaceae bacterium]|nr:DUF721 domain-containing protein [Syntrophaceae bacterium]